VYSVYNIITKETYLGAAHQDHRCYQRSNHVLHMTMVI